MTTSLAPDRRWLSLTEAGRYLGVSDRTVRRYIAQGLLSGHKLRGSNRIRVDSRDLEKLLITITTTGS